MKSPVAVAYSLTEADLRSALARDEFVLYHQPRVCLLTGRLLGSEVLVRWITRDSNVIQPDDFIPFAEKHNLIGDLTLRMLQLSVNAIQTINEIDPSLVVSMNASPLDLEQHQLSREISTILESGQIQPHQLEIEITESIAMSDFDRVSDDLDRLNSMQIQVMMDDFGTGYSSIDRLSRLPFSSLKLDKGVVGRMATSRQNLDVVRSSISMARELRMTSVAEGVESEGAYNFLVANGCEEAQGFWISKPMSLINYTDYIRTPQNLEGSQIGRVHQAMYNLMHFRKSLIDAAFCTNLSTESVLESVVDPEVRLSPENSRFGTWYYGTGAKLNTYPEYQDLEEPFLALHQCGQMFMQALQQGDDRKLLNKIIEEADANMDLLSCLLRKLERQLLLNNGH